MGDHDDDELLDPAELFRSVWIDARAFGAGHALVHDLSGQTIRTVPAAVADALVRSTSFESLADHAAAAPELVRELQGLVDLGLYVSYADVQRALVQRAEVRDASISALAVVTCDRVGSLRRCVESFGTNLSRHDRDAELVVYDDSADAGTRSQNVEVLRELQRAIDRPIRYAGEAEKRSYLDALGGTDEHWRSLLEFALFDPFEYHATYGANRNAFLLDTAGRMALSVDDDTACKLAQSPDYDDVLSIGSEEDSTEWWFFPDRAAALREADDAAVDFVGLHQELLGQTVGSRVAALTDDQYLDLDVVSGQLLHRLIKEDTEVAITVLGQVGDSGTGGVEHYLQSSGKTRERLMGSEREYRGARTARDVMRVVPFTTIGDRQVFMSGIFGLDNRQLSPPFFPVGRGEDGMFATMLRLCRTSALTASLPWCVFHDPPEQRVASDQHLWGRAGDATLQDVLMTGVGMVQLARSDSDPVDRLQRLAEHLAWFSRWSLDDLADAVRQRLANMLAARVQFLQGLLEMYDGQPSWWARDVARSIATYRQQAARPLATPDMMAPAPPLIARFAALLSEWPRMLARARDLGSDGHRVARPL